MRKNDRLHNIWYLMNYRCSREDYKYGHYADNHIQVCEEWRKEEDSEVGFENFKVWALSHGYEDGLSIDRIDNYKGYSPDNCRWVTKKEQSNNRTTNHIIEHKGETMTVAEASERYGVPYYMLSQRLRIGWPVERALTEPNNGTNKHRDITINGVTKRLFEWCKEYGMKFNAVHQRLNRGWSPEEAITTPVGAERGVYGLA